MLSISGLKLFGNWLMPMTSVSFARAGDAIEVGLELLCEPVERAREPGKLAAVARARDRRGAVGVHRLARVAHQQPQLA